MVSQVFTDIMNDPNLNWGTTDFLKIHHSIRQNQYGTITEVESYDEDFDTLSSPQALDSEEIVKNGYGDWVGGELYEIYTLKDIPVNTNPKHYRTILFNGREFEIIDNKFFGVNRGTDFQDGYFEIVIARRVKTLGVGE